MGLLLVWEMLLLRHSAMNWLDYSKGHSVRKKKVSSGEPLNK
jgi:hypothetical protein